MAPASSAPHEWRFFRSGGFDQVRIDRAEDLRHLDDLDQKLWAVLACPSSGLEFDTRTLELLDADHEGHVGAAEVRDAARFLCAALRDPGLIFEPGDAVPLSAFHTEDPTGAQLAATARQVLAYLGKADADSVSVADLADTARLFEPHHFNGDGVVPPAVAPDTDLAEAITLMVQTLGGRPDRSGQAGIDREGLDAFVAGARALCDWHDQAQAAGGAILALGGDTAEAMAAFDAVHAKVEDWFTRCRLAAFDERAAAALNPAEQVYAELSAAALAADHAGVAALPLARVSAAAELPLAAGINPAWQARLATLRARVVQPLLGDLQALTYAQWSDLAARFEAFRQWQAARPDTPVGAVEVGVLRELLAGDRIERVGALIAADLDADTAAAEIEALQRLLHYRRDLATLLRNFVNLADFYDRGSRAVFQAGTLYLDQRSCELVLRVADMARHASMAPLSGTYLVYCECTCPGEAAITIVAAMTAGSADDMMVVGRNGVFYDRQGRAWHAQVVRIVANPISVREAFWTPYRRVAAMVRNLVDKVASTQDKAVDAKAGAGLAGASQKVAAPPPAAPVAPAAPFDIAKFAGIFAAIGLALGAIGTAIVAVVTGFLGLPLWKMALAVAAILLLISGPSMVLAWLKLRRRNLGPLLDANGWAVNIRARINLPFGATLTALPQRPASALLAASDPYADKRFAWGRWLLALLLVGGALVATILTR